MSFLQSLGVLETIDHAVQQGRGVVGAIEGQTYTVYRLTASTNVSMISGTPAIASFPAKIARTRKSWAIENATDQLLVYEFVCDKTPLQLGDALVESGYGSDGGMYIFAEARPLLPNLFVRTESAVTVTRPAPIGGQASQQPASGAVAQIGNYGGTPKSSELILTLSSGLYSFESSGTYASVPCGMQPRSRVRGLHKIEFPTQVPQTEFANYLPLLPGVAILENDLINYENGDRYQVVQTFSTGDTGLQGWLCITYKVSV